MFVLGNRWASGRGNWEPRKGWDCAQTRVRGKGGIHGGQEKLLEEEEQEMVENAKE